MDVAVAEDSALQEALEPALGIQVTVQLAEIPLAVLRVVRAAEVPPAAARSHENRSIRERMI